MLSCSLLMPLAANAACIAETSGTISQSEAALHSLLTSQLYIELTSECAAILRPAFLPKDKNESTLKDHSGFKNASDSLNITAALYHQNSGS